jgi:hypothetical protein
MKQKINSKNVEKLMKSYLIKIKEKRMINMGKKDLKVEAFMVLIPLIFFHNLVEVVLEVFLEVEVCESPFIIIKSFHF